MSACVCLGDSAVHEILIALSQDEVKSFQKKQEEALRLFSVGEERSYQPDPGVVVRPSGQKVLFRPFTSAKSVGAKIVVAPAPETITNTNGEKEEKKQPLHGILIICDHNGIPTGVVNAEEVTGFRTSLSAIIPYTWRRHTDSILVFGAGKQAHWHIRLALMLRGDDIKSITVVNRSRARAKALIEQITTENQQRWKSPALITALDTDDQSYEQDLKDKLAGADVVFCTVPSQVVLFSQADLMLEKQDRRPPYVSAIGSWRPEMIELDPVLLRKVVQNGHAFNPSKTSSGGVVIVDDAKTTLKDTGEMIKSELKPEQLVEVGAILDMKQQHDSNSDHQRRLLSWLESELVVYKSIGVGLTDLVAGETILEMARKRKLGTEITDL